MEEEMKIDALEIITSGIESHSSEAKIDLEVGYFKIIERERLKILKRRWIRNMELLGIV